MKKADFITKVARKTGMTKKDTLKFLNGFLESVQEVLAAGDEITFLGFGKFSVKDTKARTILNPLTKESIDVPACKKVKFTVGKYLKEAVNT